MGALVVLNRALDPFFCFFLANAGELTLCGLLVLRTVYDIIYHLVRKVEGLGDFGDWNVSLYEANNRLISGGSFCFGHGFNSFQ